MNKQELAAVDGVEEEFATAFKLIRPSERYWANSINEGGLKNNSNVVTEFVFFDFLAADFGDFIFVEADIIVTL